MASEAAALRIGLVVHEARRAELRALVRAAGFVPEEGVNGAEILLVHVASPEALTTLARRKVPAIALVAATRIGARRAAATAGADDFLTDPARAEDLRFRVSALLGTASLSRLTINSDWAEVGSRRMALNPKTRAILTLLAEAGGRIVRSEQLIAAAWTAGDLTGPNKLRVAINTLRKGLEIAPDLPTLIVSEPGIGYRLGDGRSPD